MRLFTAIEIPAPIKDRLRAFVDRLRPAAKLSWSPVDNLHVTTKFIGEWPEDRLSELTAALQALPARPAISVAIEKLGFFPNPHSPRILWAGVHAGDPLTQLARETEDALATLGVEREQRPYSPHLTLARIKTPGKQPALLQAVAKLPSLDLGRFVADRFFLYRSKITPSGSVYTRLAEFPFAK